MNAQSPVRGGDLVAGGKAIGAGPQWLARLVSGGAAGVLGRIDGRLTRGEMVAVLPDGSQRHFGGHAPGFQVAITLHSWRALVRLATSGSVGWYQAWEAGEWDSPDPVALFALFMDNAAELGDAARARGPWRWLARAVHALRRNSRAGSQRNVAAHYDLGNDFYAAWLGETMVYSSARFADPGTSLDDAQRRKLETMAARVAGAERVLEIGCGWGALAGYLQAGGASVTAISLSDEQLAFARERYPEVAFARADYREVAGPFDAVVSVEMVEAVGRDYWPAFLDALHRCLVPGGRAAIQYIAIRDSLFDAYAASADFIQTYVFPGGMLIRAREFRALAEARGFVWEDQADFGPDYAETLLAWRRNFDRARDEGRLPSGFDERFVRLWRYYLMYCEGGFRGGGITVSQVTLVKR